MKKILLLLLLITTSHGLVAQNQVKKDEQYIRTFAKIAVQEMQLYKIPASITLAQGLLETGNGQSDLALYANNHFGIKCKSNWTGDRMYHDDDAKGECFRKYTSAFDSYRDHSIFLNRPHYQRLFSLNPKDYKGWAQGLKRAGYATNPRYAYILINNIEKYKLHLFDNITENEVNDLLASLYPISDSDTRVTNNSTNNNTNRKVTAKSGRADFIASPAIYQPVQKENSNRKSFKIAQNNFEFPSQRIKHHPNGNIKYIVIEKGDTMDQISKVYGISIEKLVEYNDLDNANSLVTNQIIFLEPKKMAGLTKTYVVRKGDNMYKIAQNNAISLSELYKRNFMYPGQEPNIGEQVFLKGKKR